MCPVRTISRKDRGVLLTENIPESSLKMDKAVALNPYSAVEMIIKKYDIFTSKRVAVVCVEGDRRESA